MLNRILGIIVALLAVVAVALGGLVFYQSTIELSSYKPTGPASGEAVTSSADASTGDADPDEKPADEEPEAPATVTTTESAPKRQDEQDEKEQPSAPGLGDSGWSANASTRCGAGETLQFAGQRGGQDFVTLCEGSDGGLTYRGDVFGGQLQSTAVGDDTSISSQYASVAADPAVIVIDGEQLRVEQSGAVVNSLTFDEYWWR